MADLGRLSAIISGELRAASGPRVVQVPDAAFRLLSKAGISPPDKAGELLDVGAVDVALAKSGLTAAERIETKRHLMNARLLPVGRAVGTEKL